MAKKKSSNECGCGCESESQSECQCGCGCSCCGSRRGMRGHGVMAIILGLLILGNVYWPTLSWWAFVGALLIIAGIAKMMHKCK